MKHRVSLDVVEKYFTSTPAPIGGVGLDEIAREAEMRHAAAYAQPFEDEELESSGYYQYRRNGEYHLYNPETIDQAPAVDQNRRLCLV